MRNFQNKGPCLQNGSTVQTFADQRWEPIKRHLPRDCKPPDPTTAAAMRLAQLRSEERTAMSQGDIAALQEIRRSIARELA